MNKIKIISLIAKEYEGPKTKVFVAATLAGISFALVLAIIGMAAEIAANTSVKTEIKFILIYSAFCLYRIRWALRT